ncbi:MAG: hypothetical protein KC418_22925 [Anaerolineales bacterium]|nr:hypothetical protein [Anaerolineales bacterium]
MTVLTLPLWHLILAICGLFSLLLGTAHFFFPVLLDFEQAIPREGAPLRPFRLGPIRYRTLRQDVHGIAWVMNHAASYILVSIGVMDLLASRWLAAPWGRWLALWLAGWWFLRAGSQLYLGRRRGDWLVLAGFALLGIIHLGAALLAR